MRLALEGWKLHVGMAVGDQVNLTAQGVASASAGYAQIRVGGTLYVVPINELTD